jgi:hypothetical protein
MKAFDIAEIAKGLFGCAEQFHLSKPPLPLPRSRRALQYRNRFTGVEAKLRVKAERTFMNAGLMEPYAGNILLRGAVDNVLHQTSPDAAILYRWINGNRPDTVDAGTLVEEVAAYDATVEFGDHRIELRVGKHHRQEPARHLGGREVCREIVLCVNCLESFLADRAAGNRVGLRPRVA